MYRFIQLCALTAIATIITFFLGDLPNLTEHQARLIYTVGFTINVLFGTLAIRSLLRG